MPMDPPANFNDVNYLTGRRMQRNPIVGSKIDSNAQHLKKCLKNSKNANFGINYTAIQKKRKCSNLFQCQVYSKRSEFDSFNQNGGHKRRLTIEPSLDIFGTEIDKRRCRYGLFANGKASNLTNIVNSHTEKVQKPKPTDEDPFFPRSECFPNVSVENVPTHDNENPECDHPLTTIIEEVDETILSSIRCSQETVIDDCHQTNDSIEIARKSSVSFSNNFDETNQSIVNQHTTLVNSVESLLLPESVEYIQNEYNKSVLAIESQALSNHDPVNQQVEYQTNSVDINYSVNLFAMNQHFSEYSDGSLNVSHKRNISFNSSDQSLEDYVTLDRYLPELNCSFHAESLNNNHQSNFVYLNFNESSFENSDQFNNSVCDINLPPFSSNINSDRKICSHNTAFKQIESNSVPNTFLEDPVRHNKHCLLNLISDSKLRSLRNQFQNNIV